MLSYEIYKLLHVAAIFLMLSAAAGAWALKAASNSQNNPKIRKLLMMIHGIAMFLILLGGFGTMARLGVATPWPTWIWIKLAIWIALGGLPVILSKRSSVSKALFFLAPALGAIAAWAAINKVGG
jgi:hypothetical protein